MTVPNISIGIMVCTCERPVMLEACLTSLVGQMTSDTWSLEICVVENDSEPRSKAVVDQIAASAPFPVHYRLEPRRGIPFARNRTVREALERGYDWIALIDDDEIAEPGWLQAHMAALHRYAAQVSYGFVDEHFEVLPPAWSKLSPMTPEPEGKSLTRASTCNVVFSRALIDPANSGLTFNPVFMGGYEDLDFFERAHEAGHLIISAPQAVVRTTFPASRTTPDRILQSAYAGAAARAQASYLRHGSARTLLRFGFSAVRRLVSGSASAGAGLILKPFLTQQGTNLYYKGRMRLARGLGSLSGLMHRPSTYYDTVDGT
ncbi:hypothetical protein GCM10011316_36370 [Roseibium aquae]|uniref:Glycosyltransferase 2-like domain-containing protein n=1 Tax=Roseibium aquae TaxID=1323746 RepID=A0A916TNL0_9HYPH|nr:glycosyltransferase family A protein [Roseibium aquae]GGB61105.1 hypothetical protein GCM10011316_36370 [Roseibium aquae]